MNELYKYKHTLYGLISRMTRYLGLLARRQTRSGFLFSASRQPKAKALWYRNVSARFGVFEKLNVRLDHTGYHSYYLDTSTSDLRRPREL